jgi:hypothetical protein
MISPGSRYEDGERVFVPLHLYDKYQNVRLDEDKVYQRPLWDRQEAVFLSPGLPLPPLPSGEYAAVEDEDLSFIAFKFLENPQSWWELAEVNPQIWYPLDIQAGELVRIPGT